MNGIGKSLVKVVQNDEQLSNALNGLEYKLAYLLEEQLKEPTKNQPITKTSAERLMLARRNKNLTQTDLQRLSGVSQVVISELENSRRAISYAAASRLSKHLDVTAKWLLFGDDEE